MFLGLSFCPVCLCVGFRASATVFWLLAGQEAALTTPHQLLLFALCTTVPSWLGSCSVSLCTVVPVTPRVERQQLPASYHSPLPKLLFLAEPLLTQCPSAPGPLGSREMTATGRSSLLRLSMSAALCFQQDHHAPESGNFKSAPII